jgi:hypothetical protein
MAVAYPAWYNVETGIVTALEKVATEENAIDTARNFIVSRDRWRPWIENQQNVALVNVMVENISPGGGGTRRYTQDRVTINIDCYVLGTTEEQMQEGTGTVTLTPADEFAAARLHLLVAQVRHAITRMSEQDFGLTAGTIDTSALKATVQIYNQEGDDNTGSYAPARVSFEVSLPFEPSDDGVSVEITDAWVKFEQTIESWFVKHRYETEE